ncbi:MAG: hypothetical protein AB7O97_06025 [Planctomycetota bacterium]
MTHPTANPPAPAPPASTPAPARSDPAGSFAVVAALGGAFAGFVTHGRSHDWLATALAAAITFFGALAALYVLHVVYRLALSGAKIAIPVALMLLVGCALDWHWAETIVRWLRDAGADGVQAAAQALRAHRGG